MSLRARARARDVADRVGEGAQSQAVGVVHDGYDEPLEVEVDGDPEMHRAVHDDASPSSVGRRVHEREFAQRVDDGAGDERQRGEAGRVPGALDRRIVGGHDRRARAGPCVSTQAAPTAVRRRMLSNGTISS